MTTKNTGYDFFSKITQKQKKNKGKAHQNKEQPAGQHGESLQSQPLGQGAECVQREELHASQGSTQRSWVKKPNKKEKASAQ